MSFNTSYLSLILIGLFFYNGAMDLPPLPRSRSFADISQLTEKNKLPLRRSNSESHLLLPEMPEQISVQFQSLGSSKEKSSSTFQQATLSSSSLKSGSYTIDPAVGVGTGAFEAISNTQIKEHIDRDFKQDESEDIQLCFDTQVQKRVDQWISELKNPQRDTPHGLLLYGPSGVGKTSLVKFLAKKTGYELLIINAPECITPYQGSGVETIQRNFRKAVELKRPVIILIEEIDCFASTDIKRDNSTSHNTATQVHLLLDRVQADYPNIFIFVTTNYYEKLPKTMTGRFEGLEIKFPTLNQRKEIIITEILKLGKKVDTKNLYKYAKWSNGWSGRDLQKMVWHASRLVRLQDPKVIIISEAYLRAGFENQCKQITDQNKTNYEIFLRNHWNKIQFAFTVTSAILGVAGLVYGYQKNQAMHQDNKAFQLALAQKQMLFQSEQSQKQIDAGKVHVLLSAGVSVAAAGAAYVTQKVLIPAGKKALSYDFWRKYISPVARGMLQILKYQQ